MDQRTLRTLALASLGGALEFYDFVIFVFLTTTIGRLFFPPGIPMWSRQLQTYALFAAGYFARPLGGLVMAHFGDTRGRKQVFTASIGLMAAPTLLIAMLPTYRVAGIIAPVCLLFLRIVQGIAIGGEAPGAWIFVAEHVQPRQVGLAVGMLTSGLSFGILLGSVVATCLNAFLTQPQIHGGYWRIPFILGGALGVAVAFLRRWLSETPVFLTIRGSARTARILPLTTILKCHRGSVGRAFVLTFFLTAMIVVTVLLAPSLLQQLFHVAAPAAQRANLYGTVGLCLSTAFLGWATDVIGVRRIAWVTIPGSLAFTYMLFAMARMGGVNLNGWYFAAGLGAGCCVLTPIAILRMFPPAVRFTGFAFSYNIAYAVCGGAAPLIVSSFSQFDRLAAPHYVCVAGICGLATLVLSKSE